MPPKETYPLTQNNRTEAAGTQLVSDRILRGLPEWPTTPSSDPFDSPEAYRRRLLISIYLSCVLNFFLLWLVLSIKLPQPGAFDQKSKSPTRMEVPRLVLVKQPPPKQKTQTFLETDPSQAVKQRPEDADFYSEHNTLATQTKATPLKSADVPKADGNNDRTPATESVLPASAKATADKPNAKPPPPSPPAEQPVKPTENIKPTPVSQPQTKPLVTPSRTGDLAILRETPAVKPSPAVEPRPETPQTAPPAVSPAPAVTPSQREVITQKSKLDGGVQRTGKALAFNSAESPFAKHDKKIIAKISGYWNELIKHKLNSGGYGGEVVGEVQIDFKLLENGRISDLRITHNTANTILASWCVKTITDSAPFDPFPEFMRALVGDHRDGMITFTY